MTAINYNAPARLWKDMLGVNTAPGKLAHLYQQASVDFGHATPVALDDVPCRSPIAKRRSSYSIQTDDSGQCAKDARWFSTGISRRS